MDISSKFESRPILGYKEFSWVFIVDLILAIVVTLFVIFFFNRLVGSILSAIARWVIWRRYKIRIKVQSIQLSLLGGRLFFKNLSYVGSNEVITALQGNFTWRYWLHKRRKTKLEAEKDDDMKQAEETIPARLALQVQGLEWVVMNRSAAYDALWEYCFEKGEEGVEGPNKDVTQLEGKRHSADEVNRVNIGIFESMFLRLMPFQVKCEKGAVIVGNKTTPSIMVVHFANGKASIDVASSKNPLDKYKMVSNLYVKKPIVEMRANIDYEGPRKDIVEKKKNKNTDSKKSRLLKALWLLLSKIKEKKGKDKKKDEDEKLQWKGLSRYLSNDHEQTTRNDTDAMEMDDLVEEYGKYSTILDATEGTLCYYYDVPGQVPQHPEPTSLKDGVDIGNGGSAPEFGFSLWFNDATIHFGPWADRQRIPLQSMLFPRYCADATVAQPLQPGDARSYTQMNLLIEFGGMSILRVPMREFSKNAEFFAQYKENPNVSLRPFGWIEVKYDESSTFAFDAALTSTPDGSRNNFRVDLKGPEIRSSVNHGLLFKAGSHFIDGEVHYPLQWNGLQNWTFTNETTDLSTFFLREHVTLLTDLVKDFGAGPPTPYNLYTPSDYHVTWQITDYAIYLNVNDLNIINNPSDFEDNTYVALKGGNLDIAFVCPLRQVETVRNEISFSVKVRVFIFIY